MSANKVNLKEEEEYKDSVDWRGKARQRYRQRQKQKKSEFHSKEEYLASDFYKEKTIRRERYLQWKTIDKEVFPWEQPRIVIDFQFASEMTQKERKSAASQVLHLYGALRKHERPLKVHLTSVKDAIKADLHCLAGFEGWKLFPYEQDYSEVFQKDEIIYLSPDSPNVLREIDPSKVYIIGGLVDHNRLKGLTQETASARGIATARLPIQEEMTGVDALNSLNPNHVFEIIADVASGIHWSDAFDVHIPMRAGYRPRPHKEEGRPDDVNEHSTGKDPSSFD